MKLTFMEDWIMRLCLIYFSCGWVCLRKTNYRLLQVWGSVGRSLGSMQARLSMPHSECRLKLMFLMCFKNNIQVWGLALVFTLSLIEQKGTAQIGREENWEEFLLEKLLEISMNDELEDAVSIDFSDYLERLSSIHARPYDLNAVSSEELR